MIKRLPTMQETQVQSLGWEDLLEKEMTTTPLFLPKKSHGWRNLIGYSPRGHKESDMTEQLHFHFLSCMYIYEYIMTISININCHHVVKSLSRVQLFVIPWTVAYQAPPSTEFSRQEYWSGLPLPSPGIFPTQESNPGLLHCRQMLLPSETPGKHMQRLYKF